MAELLVAAGPLGPFLRGEFIVAKDDGWPWTVDDLRGCYLFRITGPQTITAAQVYAQVDRMKRAATAADPEFEAPDEPDRYIEVRPSNVVVDIAALPNNVQNKLNRDGFYDVTLQEARSWVRKRRWDDLLGTTVDDGPVV